MAKETLGQLAIGIGLDFSALEADIGEAGKTLQSALSEINANTKKIRLETDIDVQKLTAAGNAVDLLTAKEKGLTREVEEQNKAVKLLKINQEYAQKTFGANSWQARKATNEYLTQVKKVETLNARLRETQATLARINGEAAKTSGALGGMSGKLQTGLMVAAKGAAGLAAGLAAAYATAQTLRQGLEWVSQGVDLSARVFDLSNQFGATQSEMAELLGIMDSAKVDAKAVFQGLVKTLDEVKDPANKTAQALSAFGVNLRDAQGRAVSTHDALFALADGFQRAAASGRQMDYIQAMPRQMRQYVDLLQKFPDYLQESQKVTRAIIDPEAAATIGDDLRTLDLQTKELKKELAAALLPVALEYVPKATQAFGELVRAVEKNKEPLQAFAEIVASIVGILPRADVGLGELAAAVQNFGEGGITDNPFEGVKDLEPAAASVGDFRKAEEKAAATSKDYAKELKDLDKLLGDSDGPDKYADKLTKLQEKLDDSIYKATHSDLETRLREISRTAEKQRQEITDAAKAAGREVPQATLDLIDENAEKQKAKAIEDFTRGTVDAIDAIFQTGLQKRLADIEREKRAWIQKGVDEVRATQAAERQKQQAVQDAAQSMFTSQRKYLDAFRKAKQQEDTGIELIKGVQPTGGGGVIGALQDILRQEMGIKPGDRTSVQEINEFNAALEQAKRTLIPIGEGQYTGPEVMRGLQSAPAWTQDFTTAINSAFAPLANGEITLGADGIESRLDRTNDELRAIREGQRGAELQAPVVNVSVVIESAVTQDNAAMRQLADTVADHITPVVENAIGQSWNSYSR